jgi:hypothetical protein
MRHCTTATRSSSATRSTSARSPAPGRSTCGSGDARRALEYFRRAIDVNPNLEGPAQMIPILEEQLEAEERRRT